MAKFKKGDKRPENAGRKKGTPNKRTADIIARLNNEDIVGSLLEIAHTTEDESIKVAVYKELMKYAYPQRKAVEMSGIDGGGLEVKITRQEVL